MILLSRDFRTQMYAFGQVSHLGIPAFNLNPRAKLSETFVICNENTVFSIFYIWISTILTQLYQYLFYNKGCVKEGRKGPNVS